MRLGLSLGYLGKHAAFEGTSHVRRCIENAVVSLRRDLTTTRVEYRCAVVVAGVWPNHSLAFQAALRLSETNTGRSGSGS